MDVLDRPGLSTNAQRSSCLKLLQQYLREPIERLSPAASDDHSFTKGRHAADVQIHAPPSIETRVAPGRKRFAAVFSRGSLS
jgi:hypothetical protein